MEWTDIEDFVVNQHGNKLVANRSVNLLDDNMADIFGIVLQHIKFEISVENFLIQRKAEPSANETVRAKP